MSNDELDVERHAGIDMLPAGEAFEWNPASDDDAPILRADFDPTVSTQVATPSAVN
jgi:hypothetical protein